MMNSPSLSPSGLTAACQRCRRRKVRCDLASPKCSQCERAKAPCVGQNLKSNRAAGSLPPGYACRALRAVQSGIGTSDLMNLYTNRYLESLESEVTRLQEAIARQSHSATDVESVPTTSNDENLWLGQRAIDWSAINDAGAATLHPELAYDMKRMVLSAIKVENSAPYRSSQSNGLFPTIRKPLCFPHPSFATYLDAYFDHVHSCLPFLDESEIRQSLQNTSSEEIITSPILLMVLAVGAIFSSFPRHASTFHCLELFTAAVECYQVAEQTETRDLLHFLLLCSLFSLYEPSGGSTWHLLGLAMQVCIQLGLHQQQPLTANPHGEPGRHNAFWAVYILDRIVALCLGRPFSIDQLDVSLKLPDPDIKTSKLRYLCQLAAVSNLQDDVAGEAAKHTNEWIRATVDSINTASASGNATLYHSLSMQLALWTLKPIDFIDHDRFNELDNIQVSLDLILVYLRYAKDAAKNQEALPWTLGYAHMYASTLWKLALVSQQEHADVPFASKTIQPQTRDSLTQPLEECARKFRGLQAFASVSVGLSSDVVSLPANEENLAAFSNPNLRESLKMLIRLTKKNAPSSATPLT